MKKSINRSFFVTLAAVALAVTLLVTNCMSSFDGTDTSNVINLDNFFRTYQPPAGMGYIRVKLSDKANNALTIVPVLPNLDNLYYHVVVTELEWDAGDSEWKPTSNIAYDSNNIIDNGSPTNKPVDKTTLEANPILVMPGEYSVEVFAYTSASTTDIVGHGESEEVEVTQASGGTATVTLSPNKSTGSGKFYYNIGLPSNKNLSEGVFSAVLNVYAYTGKSQASIPAGLKNVDLVSNQKPSAAITLPAGFYYVEIAMVDPGIPEVGSTPAVLKALQDKTITNILHIYENLQTDYGTSTTPTPLADLNLYKYTVTYNGNGGHFETSPSVFANTVTQQKIPHGSTLTAPTETLTHIDHPEYTFNSWHRNSVVSSPSSLWTLGTTKLIGPLTLYAIWDSTVKIELQINWSNPINLEFVDDTGSFSQANYYDGVNEQVTITIDNLNGYTVKEWYHSAHKVIGGTSDSITLTNDESDINYLAPGEYEITVVLEKEVSGSIVDTQNLTYYLTIN